MKADGDVSSTRSDYVFVIPPPPFYTDRRADFQLSLDNAWYGRVTLLFKMKFRHDDGKILEAECAMIDVLFNYADARYFCKLKSTSIYKTFEAFFFKCTIKN